LLAEFLYAEGLYLLWKKRTLFGGNGVKKKAAKTKRCSAL